MKSKEQTPITAEELTIRSTKIRALITVNKSHTITFSNQNGDTIGVFDFNDDYIKFKGKVEQSAEFFIEFITKSFNEKIKYEKEQYAQVKVLEALEMLYDATQRTDFWVKHEGLEDWIEKELKQK